MGFNSAFEGLIYIKKWRHETKEWPQAGLHCLYRNVNQRLPSSSFTSVGPMANATDVLQAKRLIVLTLFPPRVCTFPRSPTDAPTSPTHDARDPGSERWNYVGRELTGYFAWDYDFHVNSGIFYIPQICEIGPTASLPKEGVLRGFLALKIPDGFGRVWTRELGYLKTAHYP